MTPTLAAYLAGLIDGEGCITITKTNLGSRSGRIEKNPSYRLLVCVGICHEPTVHLLERHFGGYVYKKKPHRSSRKQAWTWTVSPAQSVPVLTTILPHLRIKRRQALLGLEFFRHLKANHYTGWQGTPPDELANRESLYLQMKALNADYDLIEHHVHSSP